MDLPSKTCLDNVRHSSPRTVERDCREWFDNFYDEQANANPPESLDGPIEPGKVYTYIYDPKYANDLPFYDTFPMFMSMGHLPNGNIIGINLSYIPPRIRLHVMDKFVRVFHTRFIKGNVNALSRGKLNQMRTIPFVYDVAKSMLAGSGFEAAIRSYLYSHIYSPPKIITYEDYWRLLAFTSEDIKKLNIRAIYALYHKKPNPTYRIGQQHPKYNIDKRVRPIQRQIRDKEKGGA